MRITQYQSNFSTGEIDPLLRARTDLQQYQNALEEATNVVVQPQGGISRRDGLEFVFDFGSRFTEFKIIPFEFSISDSYLLVFVVGRIYVFKNKILQRNINSSGNDYITASDITVGMLDELEYTQAVDTLILCHEDLQTKRLVRNSDTSWTLENLPLTNPPQYAYALDEHSPNFTITPSATTGNITITASSVTTDSGVAQAGGASTITLKSASSYTSNDDPNGMWITLTAGTGSGQERYISDYVGSTKVATVYPAWTTQPDSTTHYKVAAFAASAANNFAQVENTFGRVKYIEYVSDTIMNAVVEVPFFDTSGVVAGNWIGEFGYEDVWSSTRGWPRSATFHEGRLYFGGSKSRPNTVWGSRVIDYFNFDSHTGLDDEAVETTINTNQLNAIVNIVSGADLRIFSTGGEFIVVQSEDTPITPSNFLVRPQTRLGSKSGVPIEDLNGATIFVQRQGKAINAFQFGNDTRSYQVQNISLLSSHLLNDPVDIAVRRSSSTDEADRLFVVNGGDGSMAVYSILTGQNVIAPSKFTTDGEFVAIAVETSNVFSIVKRTIGSYSGNNPFLERAVYTEVNYSFGNNWESIYFKPDGTKFFVVSNSTPEQIIRYDLSTAWDITSVTGGVGHNISSQETIPTGIFIKPDGLKIYICGSSSDSVHEYDLSDPYGTSLSFNQSFSVATEDTSPAGLSFKTDGTKMFFIGGQNDSVYEYDLSTAWDISTAVHGQTFSIASEQTQPTDLFFLDDGTKMFVIGADQPTIVQYSLTTAWDISTASYDNISFNSNSEDNSPVGLYFKPDGTEMYIVGSQNNNLYKYSTSNIFYYLEKFNSDRTLDSSKDGGASSSSEVPHLSGETLHVIGDDIVQSDAAASLTNFSADDDGIFTLQTVYKVSELTLDGVFASSGVASFNGISRKITFTYGSTPTAGKTITITGTDFDDLPQTETITTTSSTSYTSVNKFKTVTSINQTDFGVVTRTLKVGVEATTAHAVIFASPSTTSFEVGLDYTVQAKTMPTEPTLSSGSIHGMKKRVVQVDALVDKTKDLKINGKTIAFDTESGSSAIAEYTGLKTAHGLLGYANTGQITLTQTDPLPMTVLGLEYKLSTGS